MPRILYPEFRKQFETTKYPFAEPCSLANGRGQTILEGSLLDAHLYPIGGGARLYLSRVEITTTRITFYLGDENTTNLASGMLLASQPTDNVVLHDARGLPAGVLVSEQVRLANFRAWGLGTFEFTSDQTEFCVTCCMPVPPVGVRGIILDDGTVFSGQVWIVGDDGVVIRHESTISPRGDGVFSALDTIRVDIIGDPLFRRRLCADASLFVTPNPIRQIDVINGSTRFQSTPVAGRLTIQSNHALVEDPVLRVHPVSDGVVFEVVGSPSATGQQHTTAIVLPPDYLRN